MQYQNTANKQFDTDHPSFRGGSWTITKTETGYDLGVGLNRHEIHVEGLDGGSFTVSYISQSGSIRPYRTNPLTEDKTCIMSDVTVIGIIVTPQDTGGNANPVLDLVSSSQMRGSGL